MVGKLTNHQPQLFQFPAMHKHTETILYVTPRELRELANELERRARTLRVGDQCARLQLTDGPSKGHVFAVYNPTDDPNFKKLDQFNVYRVQPNGRTKTYKWVGVVSATDSTAALDVATKMFGKPPHPFTLAASKWAGAEVPVHLGVESGGAVNKETGEMVFAPYANEDVWGMETD